MFDVSQLESGAAAVALTGAAIGWSLRPLFLRYRRAFVVAAAALATVGAAAYEVFDAPARPASPPRTQPAPQVIGSPSRQVNVIEHHGGLWADYLEKAGNSAFAERDYEAAIRYWNDAVAAAPQRNADLAEAIASARAMR